MNRWQQIEKMENPGPCSCLTLEDNETKMQRNGTLTILTLHTMAYFLHYYITYNGTLSTLLHYIQWHTYYITYNCTLTILHTITIVHLPHYIQWYTYYINTLHTMVHILHYNTTFKYTHYITNDGILLTCITVLEKISQIHRNKTLRSAPYLPRGFLCCTG